MLSHSTKKWIAKIGRLLGGLLVVYAVVVLTPWSLPICEEEVQSQSVSPDGKSVAKVFIRNCGATTGWLTHVNLRSHWLYFNTNWQGTITQGQVFSGSCWDTVKFAWKDNSNLEIQHEVCQRCNSGDDPRFVKQDSWNGIHITYRELPCNPTRR